MSWRVLWYIWHKMGSRAHVCRLVMQGERLPSRMSAQACRDCTWSCFMNLLTIWLTSRNNDTITKSWPRNISSLTRSCLSQTGTSSCLILQVLIRNTFRKVEWCRPSLSTPFGWRLPSNKPGQRKARCMYWVRWVWVRWIWMRWIQSLLPLEDHQYVCTDLASNIFWAPGAVMFVFNPIWFFRMPWRARRTNALSWPLTKGANQLAPSL